MTINLSETSLYIGIMVILVGIQIYQQIRITRLEKDNEDLWEQMATLTSGFVSKMMEAMRSNKEKQDN